MYWPEATSEMALFSPHAALFCSSLRNDLMRESAYWLIKDQDLSVDASSQMINSKSVKV